MANPLELETSTQGIEPEVGPLTPLNALDPYDGRYFDVGRELSRWFSEEGLIRSRTIIEVKYVQMLSGYGVIRDLRDKENQYLHALPATMGKAEFEEVKSIEKSTHHDVTAVVEFLKGKFKESSLSDLVEKVHFGLTSEDVNNLAWRIGLESARREILLPKANRLIETIAGMAEKYKALPMLGRTHGQPAVPTTLGKELINFAVRLNNEKNRYAQTVLCGKVTGAVGNFNALTLTFPNTDWIQATDNFIDSINLEPIHLTTQVNPNDDIARYFQALELFNTILRGFDQDMWRYISDDWLVQTPVGDGSSTMPQKVNPIDFEHSEGAIEITNALFGVFIKELTQTRLQRDLSDTVVCRFFGVAQAATIDAWQRTVKGLGKVSPNFEAIKEALYKNLAILAEPLQLLLRQARTTDAYRTIKAETQGKRLGIEDWNSLIEKIIQTYNLEGTDTASVIRRLTPETYIGEAVRLTEEGLESLRS